MAERTTTDTELPVTGAFRKAFYVSLAGILILLAVSVGLSWPTNVFTNQALENRQAQKDASLFLPQGWSFFTKSPQEPSLLAFSQGPDGWHRVDTLPQSSAANLFGLSRNQRAQTTETALLASQVPFTDCNDYLSVCLIKEFAPVQTVGNPTRSQQVCGDIRLVTQTPAKWAYRDLVPEDVRVAQYADIHVTCETSQ